MKFEQENGRFQDGGKYINEFGDEFLVVCPKCEKQAKVLLIENKVLNISQLLAAPRKLVCLNCGHNAVQNKMTASIGAAFDWYFRQPLWLQVPCCQNVLWAYNKRHLEFIEGYVSAKLRTRKPNVNQSLASRLPQWIKDAKNRDEILKCVGRLKAKLGEKNASV